MKMNPVGENHMTRTKAASKFGRGLSRATVAFILGLALGASMTAQSSILTFNLRETGSAQGSVGSGEYFLVTPTSTLAAYLDTAVGYGSHISSATVATSLNHVDKDGVDKYPTGISYHYDISNGITPNIALSYSNGADVNPSSAWSLYNDVEPGGYWTDAVYLYSSIVNDNNQFYFTFIPEGGKLVDVNSFDLSSYAGTITAGWKVWGGTIGGTLLDSGTATAIYGTGFTTTTISMAPYAGPAILEILQTSGSRGDFALDNLSFSEAVPEPVSVMLLGVGAWLVLARRGRAGAEVLPPARSTL
jgi:hypothetical protein